MDRLPDELVLHILSYLDANCLAQMQRVSKKLLSLARDTSLWKDLCFARSNSEKTRQIVCAEVADGLATSITSRSLWLTDWDPGYPNERVDYLEEYIHRYVDINTSWKHIPNTSSRNKDDRREITGLATFSFGGAGATHAVTPVDDGSVLIWDLSSQGQSHEIAGHSGPGLLTPGARSPVERQYWMTKGTSIEVVSVDNHEQRGYFAINDMLHEVDLASLSLVSSKRFLCSISTLSTCSPEKPLMVGTSQTIHIYDRRDRRGNFTEQDDRLDGSIDHVILAQPSLSTIMHLPADSIVVAGRFASLLEYSLRYLSRPKSLIHSGAHTSSMTMYPHRLMSSYGRLTNDPSILTDHLERKAMPAYTIVAVGAYKGKGSLELYCRDRKDGNNIEQYINRHAASSSKLLSVATHGTKLVYSDGNGRLEWVCRQGRDRIRTHQLVVDDKRADTPTDTQRGLWGITGAEQCKVDIAQKIVPYAEPASLSGRRPEKLLLWTGEGRLGVLGFGPCDIALTEEFYDAVETQAESAAERARHDAERQYAMAMRRALERNADEVRFVRGLGLEDMMPGY